MPSKGPVSWSPLALRGPAPRDSMIWLDLETLRSDDLGAMST